MKLDVETIKRTCFKDREGKVIPAPPAADLLIALAEARELDPLVGDCYFAERGGTWMLMASIDSMRKRAESTGDYGGQDEPVFVYDEKGTNIVSCKVAVYRKSVPGRAFATGVAQFREFTTGKALWASKPHVMISKVAEMAGLRKAFPAALAKVYASEELDQADVPKADTVKANALAEDLLLVTKPANNTVIQEMVATAPLDIVQEFVDAYRAAGSPGAINAVKARVAKAVADGKVDKDVAPMLKEARETAELRVRGLTSVGGVSKIAMDLSAALAACSDAAKLANIVGQIADVCEPEEKEFLAKYVREAEERIGVSS